MRKRVEKNSREVFSFLKQKGRKTNRGRGERLLPCSHVR
jgi:hypothetical protein